jgi:uncharacterized membrane protein
MAEPDGVFVFLGVYDELAEAQADFDGIKVLKHEKFLGGYESALVQKTLDEKVTVINTDATERGWGAKLGAATGLVLGIIFPPTLLAGAVVGGGLGALVGNFQRGMKKGDVKALGEELAPGQAAVIVIAETTIEEGVERLMGRAKKVMKEEVDVQADEIKKAIDDM